MSGTEIKPSEEVKKEQVGTPLKIETATKKEQTWSDYLPSFGWRASIAPQQEKETMNPMSVVESKKGTKKEACDHSEITEQICNTTAHYVNVIKHNASEEIEVEALPASMVESSIKKSESKKVSFGSKSKEQLTSESEEHMPKDQKKKSRDKKSKRSRKKNELKKYLKKSLKAYLKDAGPNTTPKSVESQLKKLEKSVEQMVHSAVKKERNALLHTVPIIDEREEASATVTSKQMTTGSRQEPEAVVDVQPSGEHFTMSSFQEKAQSDLRDVSSLSANTQSEKIDQLSKELNTIDIVTSTNTSTSERELPSEPEASSGASALCQSKSQDAATRWESYMKNLRTRRDSNFNASAAALKISTPTEAATPTTTQTEKKQDEDMILKMNLLETQIAEERNKAKACESYMMRLDKEARDESRDVADMETREGMSTSFQLQHFPSFPSVVPSCSSIVSTSTILLTTKAKLALEEQIHSEMVELQAAQDKITYNLNMAAYSKRRPTILTSDLFSKSVFDHDPLKSKEAEKADMLYQREMEILRAKQADLFAKGRELTQL